MASESVEHLLWRVQQSAFFLNEAPKKGGRRPKRKSKLQKLIDELTPLARLWLLKLVEGDAAIVTVAGVSYAVAGADGRWTVTDFEREHTVLGDLSACSCEDNRFRSRECKHILALRRFFRA